MIDTCIGVSVRTVWGLNPVSDRARRSSGLFFYPVAEGACGTPGREVWAIDQSQFGETVAVYFEFLHICII